MRKSRYVLLCLPCFLAGVVLCLALRSEANVDGGGLAMQPDPYVGIASPDLTPETVVSRQVQAIRESLASPDRIHECFAFASPSNREMTGPIERFAAMVTSEPYSPLALASEIQVGTAVVEGDFAAVLVTGNSEAGFPTAFRFILEKQPLPPYTDCWMTVAVEFVEVESEDFAKNSF